MKDTLQEAINVGVFDIRKRVTSEMALQIQEKHREHTSKLAELEEEISHKEDVEETLKMTEEKKEQAETRVQQIKGNLDSARNELAQAERARDRSSELQVSKKRKEVELSETIGGLERREGFFRTGTRSKRGSKGGGD